MNTNNPYLSFAQALFDLNNKNQQKEIYLQLTFLNKISKKYPQFNEILNTWKLSKEYKKKFIHELLNSLKFEKILIYWLWLIIDNNFFSYFHLIYQEYLKIYYHFFNILPTILTSAHKLSQKQLKVISDFLQKKISKKIFLQTKIDPQLIGGLKIQIGDKIYDNSYQSKLNNLKQIMFQKEN